MAPTPQELRCFHRPVGSFQGSPGTSGPPRARSHSAYAETRSSSLPPDDSEYSPAAPETIQSSSTKISRDTALVPAAKPQGHKSLPRQTPRHPCIAACVDKAAQAAPAQSLHAESASRVQPQTPPASQTSPAPPSGTGAAVSSREHPCHTIPPQTGSKVYKHKTKLATEPHPASHRETGSSPEPQLSESASDRSPDTRRPHKLPCRHNETGLRQTDR